MKKEVGIALPILLLNVCCVCCMDKSSEFFVRDGMTVPEMLSNLPSGQWRRQNNQNKWRQQNKRKRPSTGKDTTGSAKKQKTRATNEANYNKVFKEQWRKDELTHFLLAATIKGQFADHELMEKALKAGANPNAVSINREDSSEFNRYTALYLVLRCGAIPQIKTFLQAIVAEKENKKMEN